MATTSKYDEDKHFDSNIMGTKTLMATASKYDEDKNFDSNSNQSILTATIKSIRYTKRFNESFFEQFY